MDEFLSYIKDSPVLSNDLQSVILADRAELAGNFRRDCGYCMAYPAGIIISECARMSLMVRRSPSAQWFTPRWQANMEAIENCLPCAQCAAKYPFGLDTPALLARNLKDYRQQLYKK